MKKGWIREGWLRQEGELLLHLRDRQDERQLLGGGSRVLQDRDESEKVSLGDTGRRRYLIKKTSSRRLLLVIKGVSTLTIKKTQAV